MTLTIEQKAIIGLLACVLAELVVIGGMGWHTKDFPDYCNAHMRAQMDKCDCVCLQGPPELFNLNTKLPAEGQQSGNTSGIYIIREN